MLRIPPGERSTRGQVRIPEGTFWMGDSHGDGYAADGELPAAPRPALAVPHRHEGRDERPVRLLREGDRLRHRRRARRRVGGVPPRGRRRPGRHPPGRGRRAVVAGGARRGLAPSGGSALEHRRPAEPPGRPRVVARRAGLLPLGRQAPADRGRVGVRRPRRPRPRAVSLGRRAHPRRPVALQHLAGRVPAAQHPRRRLPHHRAGDRVPAQRLRPAQHGRQRVGVVPRRVPRDRVRRPGGRRTPSSTRSRRSRPRRTTHRYGG